MKTTLTVALMLVILASVSAPVIYYWWRGGFRKPYVAPTHATLLARPGVTLDLVDSHGVVRIKVVCAHITRDQNGTSARFEDYVKYMERVTYRDHDSR